MRVLLRQTPVQPALEHRMQERWFDLDEFDQFEDDDDVDPDDHTYSLEREVCRWVGDFDFADSFRIVKAEPQIVDDDNLGDSLSDVWEFAQEFEASDWDDYNIDGLRAYAYGQSEDLEGLLGNLDDLAERYGGHHDDTGDYAKEWYEVNYADVPGPLADAIDWDTVWDNNLGSDYSYFDHPRNYGVYIFRDYM